MIGLCVFHGLSIGCISSIAQLLDVAVYNPKLLTLALQGLDPRKILVCTFTVKAAQEMQERLAAMGLPKVRNGMSWLDRAFKRSGPLLICTCRSTAASSRGIPAAGGTIA